LQHHRNRSGHLSISHKELGVPLFDRAKRQIRLTYHDEIFLKDAKTVLASADGAVANMQRSLRSEVGTLTVGVFARGTGPFFSAIIKEFKRRFQDVQVSLVEITTAAAQHRACESRAGARFVSYGM
jgi:DNA-binding transcriptional LysR family regulator